MPFDLIKPFKMGRVTHRGLAKADDPMFQVGPIIAGKPLTEWLGSSPKKVTDEDTVAGPKAQGKSKR